MVDLFSVSNLSVLLIQGKRQIEMLTDPVLTSLCWKEARRSRVLICIDTVIGPAKVTKKKPTTTSEHLAKSSPLQLAEREEIILAGESSMCTVDYVLVASWASSWLICLKVRRCQMSSENSIFPKHNLTNGNVKIPTTTNHQQPAKYPQKRHNCSSRVLKMLNLKI